MIPRKNDTISLVTLSTRDRRWIVKGTVSAHVESVEIVDNREVHIVATVEGRQYQCQRPFQPETYEELCASVWVPVSSRRVHAGAHLFVEAVIAFNLHRELGKRPSEFACDGAIRTSIVPYTHNSYCARHDRVHYWGERCPKCASAFASKAVLVQTA